MIKLTEVSGEMGKFKTPIWVPDSVVVRAAGDGRSQLKVPSVPGWVNVTESPEQVVRKIMDYKLAMKRYDAIAAAEANTSGEGAEMLAWSRGNERSVLNILAGLEESPDA